MICLFFDGYFCLFLQIIKQFTRTILIYAIELAGMSFLCTQKAQLQRTVNKENDRQTTQF